MKTFRYVSASGEVVLDMAHGFLISAPDGIDTVAVTVNQAQGINQVGATVQSISVQPRPVTVTGRFVGEFQSENKQLLQRAVRPDLPGKLYCDDLYLDVQVTATPVVGALKHYAEFQFSLLAPYPYWQKDEQANATLSSVEPRFKFPWKICQPYQFGEVIQAQFINIYNGGDVEIPYTVTFTAVGEVVNPKLIDAATNKYLLINKTLVSGERLVVEITHERTNVYSSVDGECRGSLNLGSSFNRLVVGDNVIKPEATSGKDNLQIDIDYATERVGVVL